ncbi:protein K [Providencia sp. Me31A]|uniref:protein K n=1 Tax=Providencia sp. Me31A TaxID=3392637 RepID=UPI003D29C289
MVLFQKLVWLLLGVILVVGCSPDADEKTKTEQLSGLVTNADVKQRYDKIKANSTEDKIKAFNEKGDDDPTLLRGIFLSDMAKALPMLVDDVTLLTEVTAKNGMLFYQYTIKGIPDNVLEEARWQQNMREGLDKNYCSKGVGMKVLHEMFPDGITHNYYKSNKLIFTYIVTPTICHE